jgi:type IV secretion system protein VirD4
MTEQRGFFERWLGSLGGNPPIDDSQHIKPGYGPYIGLWAEGSDPHWRYDPMRYEGDGHQLIVAPSRSGKGRDALVPSLLTNLDSMFVLDVKGELAATTARARMELGHEVFCINPFGLHTGPPWHLPQHGWNPLIELDPDDPNFTSDIESLASALIHHDSAESAHWSEGAKFLIVGLIVHEVLSCL